jgi:hypothetical protein
MSLCRGDSYHKHYSLLYFPLNLLLIYHFAAFLPLVKAFHTSFLNQYSIFPATSCCSPGQTERTQERYVRVAYVRTHDRDIGEQSRISPVIHINIIVMKETISSTIYLFLSLTHNCVCVRTHWWVRMQSTHPIVPMPAHHAPTLEEQYVHVTDRLEQR